MSPAKRRAPTRGYGITPWSRAVVDVLEGRTRAGGTGEPTVTSARITKARSYFRDRKVHRLQIGAGTVTASVEGSQLDPFSVAASIRTVDTETVASLLRTTGDVGDLMSLTRGEQPSALGELLLPTESADIRADCDCPDDTDRCIHILSVFYEVAAEIDRTPTTLLTLMGTEVADLLGALERHSGQQASGTDDVPTDESAPLDLSADFYGNSYPTPPLPSPPPIRALSELDVAALRGALRASGIAAGDIAEALDDLGDLYDRIVDRR